LYAILKPQKEREVLNIKWFFVNTPFELQIYINEVWEIGLYTNYGLDTGDFNNRLSLGKISICWG
jgi:hypothetical protein